MDIDYVAELNNKIHELTTELTSYKEQLKQTGQKSICGNHYTAKISDVTSHSLNQEEAVKIAKKLGAKWLLKEVVDMDLLNDSLYNRELNAKDFESCINTKVTQKIKFIKKKEKTN